MESPLSRRRSSVGSPLSRRTSFSDRSFVSHRSIAWRRTAIPKSMDSAQQWPLADVAHCRCGISLLHTAPSVPPRPIGNCTHASDSWTPVPPLVCVVQRRFQVRVYRLARPFGPTQVWEVPLPVGYLLGLVVACLPVSTECGVGRAGEAVCLRPPGLGGSSPGWYFRWVGGRPPPRFGGVRSRSSLGGDR